MTATVLVPTLLRQHTITPKVNVKVGSVADVLDELEDRFPGFSSDILTPEHDINRFVNIYVNSSDVRFLDGLDTPVGDGDTVSIFPAISGGCGV